jgi:F0F1-type ATP synthase epsilon subunit
MDEQVASVRFQKPDGWQGILPHHTHFLTRLVHGVLVYRLTSEGAPHYLALYGGTLEVRDNQIHVLSTAAERGADLKELEARLQQEQEQADALAFEAYIEFTKVRAALLRALTDLPEAPEAIE